jgi:hypothetical protein
VFAGAARVAPPAAASAAGPAPLPIAPAAPVATPAPVERTIELLSGVDGEGLGHVTDNRTGQPLEAHAVQPRFPGAYAEIPGAQWISDRFGPALGNGLYQQARAYENATGATIEPRPTAACLPDGQCYDLGDAWHSSRTFRTSFTLPALAEATSITLQFAVDNVASVVLDPDDPATRRTLLAASCDTFTTCTAAGPTGEGHFSTSTTVSGDPSEIGGGLHTVEFRVDDWGSVTGLVYKLTVGYLDVAVEATCAPTAHESCSLTVAPAPGSDTGGLRFCYSPPDDQARTVWLRDRDGVMQPYTLAPHTWLDTPSPADGLVGYPTAAETVPLADLADPALTRCPGAIPAS